MNYAQQDCDDSRLLILLHGDEQDDGFHDSAVHLESCATCRRRLTELAADGDTWTEVAESLRADKVDIVHDAAFQESPAPRLDFLNAPTHPEMLGRLGRYEIERVVGTGGMGIVLKGHDSELHRPVAIKVLAPHLAHSGAARQRFAREGRAAAAIVHEHVVAIHNVESEAETPFLVMQLVPGRSLQARVDDHGPLGVKEILRIGAQAAAGLAAAHAQGVVHRDVKPSNILLEHDVERVLITDFGLARVADDASMTRSGIVAGTPHYMSPEQANGSAVDPRSDLFSLGAVLYFMATGHPPFRAERTMAVLNRICNDRQRPVWEVNSDIPVELSDLIDCLLEKGPHRRIGTAEAVQHALTNLLKRTPQSGPRRIRSRLRRWYRRNRRGVAVGGVAAAVGIAAAGWGYLFDGGRPHESSGGLSTSTTQDSANEAPRPFAQDLQSVVDDVQRDLARVEARVEAGARFQQSGTADWDEELAAVKRDLLQLEKQTPSQPFVPGETQ